MITPTQMAVFGHDGTKKTNETCREEIMSFGKTAEQFEMIRPVMDQLWVALTHKFRRSSAFG